MDKIVSVRLLTALTHDRPRGRDLWGPKGRTP